MPAVSEKQRRAMGAALAAKRGEAKVKRGSPSAKMAASMTESELEDFARKPKKSRKK